MSHQAQTEYDEYVTLPAPDTLRIERLLPGPIERVWSYLTDSGKRGRWLASGAVEQHVGGLVEHVFRNSELTENDDPPPEKYAAYAGETRMQGRVTACEPPRLLAYTWGGVAGDSEVTFELADRGDKVLLVVTHSRVSTHDDLLGASAGWHTHLDILVARLADHVPPRFWATHTRLEAEYAQRFGATLGSGR
jgi:uncharacterized protein YndB with AHSA1/START domain